MLQEKLKSLAPSHDWHTIYTEFLHTASNKTFSFWLVVESELLNRIKKNKVSKALFLTEKALLMYNNTELYNSNKTKSLLEVTHPNIFILP